MRQAKYTISVLLAIAALVALIHLSLTGVRIQFIDSRISRQELFNAFVERDKFVAALVKRIEQLEHKDE